jgi:hypothetical protein
VVILPIKHSSNALTSNATSEYGIFAFVQAPCISKSGGALGLETFISDNPNCCTLLVLEETDDTSGTSALVRVGVVRPFVMAEKVLRKTRRRLTEEFGDSTMV